MIVEPWRQPPPQQGRARGPPSRRRRRGCRARRCRRGGGRASPRSQTRRESRTRPTRRSPGRGCLFVSPPGTGEREGALAPPPEGPLKVRRVSAPLMRCAPCPPPAACARRVRSPQRLPIDSVYHRNAPAPRSHTACQTRSRPSPAQRKRNKAQAQERARGSLSRGVRLCAA